MTPFRQAGDARQGGDVASGGPALLHSAPALPRRRRSGRFKTGFQLLAVDLAGCAVPVLLTGSVDAAYVGFVLTTVVVFRALGLYRRRLSLSVLNDAPYLLAGVTAGVLASLALRDLLSAGTADTATSLLSGLVVLVAVVSGRMLAYAQVRRSRRSGTVSDVGLIIGAGHIGLQLARNLQEHREYGVLPVGFVDSNPRVAALADLPAPLLGDYGRLAEIISTYQVNYVMVAFGAVRESQLVDILRTCDRLDCDIAFVPRLFELHQTTRSMDDVWGVPLLQVRRAAFRTFSWRVKRVVDIVVAGAGLLLLAPVLVACAAAVRTEGPGSVLFRQERVGLDGRPFHILKFRTLAPTDRAETEILWNISDDPRVGRVGRFLRATSLDELPQLWNILTGGMSLVGPRPERQHFVKQFSGYVPRYTARHRVPAGLTGWAQVHGLRGDTSIRERAAFDNYYIENWSLWGDVKIMLRTIGQVLRRSGG